RNYRSEQPFGCEVCGQAFSLRGRLGPHRQASLLAQPRRHRLALGGLVTGQNTSPPCSWERYFRLSKGLVKDFNFCLNSREEN
ncbi:hypothetical protein E2I00_000168, partial [Balaenoptera physalus]